MVSIREENREENNNTEVESEMTIQRLRRSGSKGPTVRELPILKNIIALYILLFDLVMLKK